MSKDSLYINHSDEEIILFLKKDNHKAFTELYNRHWRRLFVVAYNKLNNHEEAEELTQDIFSSIWDRRHEIEIQTNLKSYLSVALKYKIISFMAKKNHQKKSKPLSTPTST